MLMDAALESFVTRATGARGVERVEHIQTLWGGYGRLLRAHLRGGPRGAVIVKHVIPPRATSERDMGHQRKLRSYVVEQVFYARYAERCPPGARVAAHLGQTNNNDGFVLLLEDLDAAGYSRRRRDPRGAELDVCLGWLAAFHAAFLHTAPDDLWAEGSYWHLATRPDELAAIAGTALHARAPENDRRLRQARHRTLIHGDAKPANFCFRADGRAVAAVDFQYVGGGTGMRDVAYLLHGLPSGEATGALDMYFARLRASLSEQIDVDALEDEWRALYPVAVEDFARFVAGWRG
jgi:hypothetical protein